MSDLLDLCTPNATWHDGPCAEVRVGDHVIRYVRRGSGSSVVVVGADAQANPLWRPLIEILAANHRLVVPQPPPADADVGSWLREFIEGTGLTSIVLIAGGASAAAALELATSDDVTVRKLVLLATAEESAASANEAAATGQPTSGRTLWVLSQSSAGDSLRRIQQFIAADVAA